MFELANLKKIRRLGAAPEAMSGFRALDDAALVEDIVSGKNEELPESDVHSRVA